MPDRKVRVQVVLEEGAEAVVVRGGIRIQFNVSVGIDVFGNVPVTLYPPVNDVAQPQAGIQPQIGDTMADGTKFAGISPDTGKPMYALPADTPLTVKWKQAMAYADTFRRHGHPKSTFRVPTTGELNVLFQNRAKIGGFNETGSYPSGWYWSSTEHRGNADCAWVQRFVDGRRDWHPESFESSLRLVRS